MKRIISFLLALLIISSVVLTSCGDKPPCTHDDPNNIFIISAKEPDCTNTGLTEGVKCGYCGTMILPQKEIPTNENHSFTDWLVVGEPEPDEAKVETRHCRLCGKREERITEPSIDDSTDDMKYDPTQEVTITFYHSMGSQLQSILDKYIEKFNEIYPNIHVEHTKCGSYDDVYYTIMNDLKYGTQPNIAYCYPEHVASYLSSGKVIALDGMIDNKAYGLTSEQKADIFESFFDEGSVYCDNMTYTLPFSKSTELLYYNKTFFEEHDISVPTTWDEMEEVCRRMKEIDPDCIPLGHDSESNLFITLCEQLGSPYVSATGEHYLFDNETNRAFVKRIVEWYQKGYILTANISLEFSSDRFSNQEMYMAIGSSAGARYQRGGKVDGVYPFEVGITSIPQVDPNDPKVLSMGPSLVMLESGSVQENMATWLFMKFLVTNPELQAEVSMSTGYMPVIKSANDVPTYSAFISQADGGDNILSLAIKKSIEQSNAYFRTPAFEGSVTARYEVGNILYISMLNGELLSSDLDAVIDAAFKAAIEHCNE